MWMIFWWIASMVVSALLTPKPQVEDAKVANASDANFPTALSTATVPVVWGKVRLRSPILAWYGDYRTVPIIKTQSTSGFFGIGAKSVDQTIGYKYYWGQHLVLCHGQVTLHRLWADERLIWTGPSTGDTVIVDNEGLYGGEESGGGITALIDFYPGGPSQTPNEYLTAQLGQVPAYNGVASLVWRGPSAIGLSYTVPGGGTRTAWKTSGYIGTSPAPQPINAEVSRYPNPLNDAYSKIGEDANPAAIIYECLTNDALGEDGWGMGLAPAMLDMDSFLACSSQLFTEGFGVSMAWESPAAIDDVIADLCKVIDAQCYRDFASGKMRMKLIRQDYNPATLPVLDESNILTFSKYSQGVIESTSNEVVVTYRSRELGYVSSTAQAQDLANMRQQNNVVSQAESFLWITLASLADRVANRDLLSVSVPAATAEVTVNREAYAYGPGDPFQIVWPELGIDSMIMRVKTVAIGMPTANQIRMELIQDVFSLAATAYSDPKATCWVDPLPAPATVTTHMLMEAPYLFNQDLAHAQFLYLSERPNVGSYSLELLDRLANDPSGFTSRGVFQGFCPSGLLLGDYGASPLVDGSGTLTLTGDADMGRLTYASESLLRQGANLFIFAATGEICEFSDIHPNADGTYTLSGVWRGLLDTVPVAHAAGERIYFLNGASFPAKAAYDQAAQVQAFSRVSGPKGLAADSAVINLTFTGRNLKPLPPGGMQVNGLTAPASIIGTCSPTWAFRNRLTQTGMVRQDDAGATTSEGSYNVRLYVNGVLKHSYDGLTTAEIGTVITGGPRATWGICMRANGDFFLTSSYPILGGAGPGPHCVFKVTSAGFTLAAGDLSAYGWVNGTSGTARFQWPGSMAVDSTGAVYIVDNRYAIRKMLYSSNSVDTLVDLTSYGVLGTITVDGSDNLYVFASTNRLLLKITPGLAVSTVAGNSNVQMTTELDGTGSAASFRPDCLIAADASGNVFALDQPRSGVTTNIRYVTPAGVVTTIYAGLPAAPGAQAACMGSDVYFGDNGSAALHKCTPAGVVTTFATHPDGFHFNLVQKDLSAGGFLVYLAYSGAVSEYGRIDASGVVTAIYRSVPQTGYSAAARLQDDSNGAHLVEVRVQQQGSGGVSAFNTTGPFQMSGFGMCFGQLFGGKQA